MDTNAKHALHGLGESFLSIMFCHLPLRGKIQDLFSAFVGVLRPPPPGYQSGDPVGLENPLRFIIRLPTCPECCCRCHDRFSIDPMSAQYLKGTQVDYVETAYASGFSFSNPQAKSTCGCGSSFSV